MAGNTATARRLGDLAGAGAARPSTAITAPCPSASSPPRRVAADDPHRLVGELVGGGSLARRAGGDFVVGRRVWDLGLLAPVQSGLRQLASPFLHDLYGATLATVHLAVRDGTRVLYVDRLAGTTSVPVVSQVGSRLPLHATGVGKVLLAHAPDDVRAAVLADLPRITPTRSPSPAAEEQLRRVRRDGWAQTTEEMSLGACSVAVPVRGRSARSSRRSASSSRASAASGPVAGRAPGGGRRHRPQQSDSPNLPAGRGARSSTREGRRLLRSVLEGQAVGPPPCVTVRLIM